MSVVASALRDRFGTGPLVDGYYAPIAEWCLAQWRDARAEINRATLLIGINGPQGCGKSTLAEALADALGKAGVRALALSIDDLYSTRAEQVAVSAAFPGDRLLEHRGYPGTHDVELGVAVLDALRQGRPVDLPAYDKSAFGGRGDRVPRERWRHCDEPFDIVLFEGWMLGFEPLAAHELGGRSALAAPNALLAAYAEWNQRLDAMIVLHTRRLQDVVAWRLDAERARRSRGEGALSDSATRDYIRRFLPAYRAWLPRLLGRPPGRVALRIELGADRLPVRAVGAADLRAVSRRAAHLADLPLLLALVEQTMRGYVEKSLGHWDLAATRAALEGSLQDGHWQLLRVGDALLGALAIHRDGSEVRIGELFVEPAQQGRGWGTALVAEVLAEAHGCGLPVRLRVLRSNPAQRLYARLGFEVERASRERLWMVARPPGLQAGPGPGSAGSA